MPHVSVCIPAYKDVKGIRRLFESLEKQNYRDYEIIVTDDTTDSSVEDVIDEFRIGNALKSNSNIKITYIRNEKPLGPAGNWNKSISLAGGDYVKVIHQDDYLTYVNSLENYVKLLDDNPEAVLGFSGSRQIPVLADGELDLVACKDRHITYEELSMITYDWRNLFLGGFIGAPSAVIYRNCENRFDSELSWLIDGDFYMSLLANGGQFACNNSPLISICEGDSQLTNSCIKNADLVLKEHRHLFTKYNLGEFEDYRRKLIQVAIEYKKSYKDISDLGIPKSEYDAEMKIHRQYLFDFYTKLIVRKTRSFLRLKQ